MQQAQAGTTIWVARPTTGTNDRGPYLFDNDAFDCGASTTVACVIVSGGDVTVENSTFTFPTGTPPFESVYAVSAGSSVFFTDDTATGYGTAPDGSPGTVDSTSAVNISGGTWTPGS